MDLMTTACTLLTVQGPATRTWIRIRYSTAMHKPQSARTSQMQGTYMAGHSQLQEISHLTCIVTAVLEC